MLFFLRIVGERLLLPSKLERLLRRSLSLVINLSFESFLCIYILYIPPIFTVFDRPGELILLTTAEELG